MAEHYAAVMASSSTTGRAADVTGERPTGPRTAAGDGLTTRRPSPEVWREALRLADGDARRIEVGPDGSVTITNHRIR